MRAALAWNRSPLRQTKKRRSPAWPLKANSAVPLAGVFVLLTSVPTVIGVALAKSSRRKLNGVVVAPSASIVTV